MEINPCSALSVPPDTHRSFRSWKGPHTQQRPLMTVIVLISVLLKANLLDWEKFSAKDKII